MSFPEKNAFRVGKTVFSGVKVQRRKILFYKKPPASIKLAGGFVVIVIKEKRLIVAANVRREVKTLF